MPVLGEVMAGGAAESAGLRAGDLVLKVGAVDVTDGAQLHELIRASVQDGKARTQPWRIERAGAQRMLDVTADVVSDGMDGGLVGRRRPADAAHRPPG